MCASINLNFRILYKSAELFNCMHQITVVIPNDRFNCGFLQSLSSTIAGNEQFPRSLIWLPSPEEVHVPDFDVSHQMHQTVR